MNMFIFIVFYNIFVFVLSLGTREPILTRCTFHPTPSPPSRPSATLGSGQILLLLSLEEGHQPGLDGASRRWPIHDGLDLLLHVRRPI